MSADARRLLAVLVACLLVGCQTGRARAEAPGNTEPMALPAAIAEARAGMRRGLTDLRQAAISGEPALLQEAEREVLTALLDGLAASVASGRLDPVAYAGVAAGVTEVEGLFKEIPYRLVVDPGDGPGFTLRLRRSPLPLIQARGGALGWRVTPVPGGARLSL